MTINKEMRMTRDEVTELTVAALKTLAEGRLGLPTENEELVVDYSPYGSSIVRIETKKPTEEKENA